MIPTVPGDDRGLLLGEGLFETILCKAGQPVLWEAHLRRLARACAALELPAPDPLRLASAAREALAEAGLLGERAAVRLTWTGGSGERGLERPAQPRPRLIAAAAPAPRPSAPAVLATASIRRNETSPAARFKTLAYLDNVLARREARAQGADEALMLNTRGEAAGGAAANLFWLSGEQLHTPALDCGVLDGIMRAEVIAAAPSLGLHVMESRAAPSVLEGARAAFLTSSLIGVRPVAMFEGRSFSPDARVEALARLLSEAS